MCCIPYDNKLYNIVITIEQYCYENTYISADYVDGCMHLLQNRERLMQMKKIQPDDDFTYLTLGHLRNTFV